MTSVLSKVYPTAVDETQRDPEKRLGDASSDSTANGGNAFVIDEATERRILMKTDLHVLPILGLLFLVSFVDRTNIGNANIQGLQQSLNMKGNQYNIALFVFNIAYVVCDLPSNLLLRKSTPAVYISIMMFCWGICTIGQGVTKSWGGLVACRFLMGIFEGGLVPGCAYLIGCYYKRHEFQWRYSFFFCASILAGAFGGFLAYLLAKLDGKGGYEAWRWIFLIEGILTCLISVASYFLIVPWPRDVRFFSPEEKEIFLRRLESDSSASGAEHFDMQTLKACLRDWKIWLFMLAYFGADNTASSFASFQPAIVQSLGYSASDAQVHTIPVYIVALVLSLSAAYFSDRLKHRYAFCISAVGLSVIGWAIQLGETARPGVRYFGLFLCLGGTYVLMPTLIVWLSNNMGGSFKRNVAVALVVGGGNCANFVSANVFIQQQAPRWPVGFGVGLALQVTSGIACTALALLLWRENRRRDALGPDASPASAEDKDDAEKRQLGEADPAFRFTL